MSQIILASQSPRRKQLLEWAEVNFQIIVADTDESFPESLTPEEASVHIAMGNARAVQQKADGQIIIAADTIVVLNDEIIGKPVDRNDAVTILNKLSGTHHKVITGVVILQNEKTIYFYSFTGTGDVEELRLAALKLADVTEVKSEYKTEKSAGRDQTQGRPRLDRQKGHDPGRFGDYSHRNHQHHGQTKRNRCGRKTGGKKKKPGGWRAGRSQPAMPPGSRVCEGRY